MLRKYETDVPSMKEGRLFRKGQRSGKIPDDPYYSRKREDACFLKASFEAG